MVNISFSVIDIYWVLNKLPIDGKVLYMENRNIILVLSCWTENEF